MQFVASARYIRFSPFKLRPISDVIRGKDVNYALNWLSTYAVERVVPIQKVIESAAANAKYLNDLDASNLAIKEIRVDQGPAVRYFKPGAQGRSNLYRKRFSHISVILEPIDKKEA